MTTQPVRVRFAPSPTGDLHVGGARSALYNWLYARRNGGVFVLRVEDTDAERSTEESTRTILEGMRWLGLDWDEGPFYQSQRGALYTAAIERLHDAGRLYRCFLTKDELAAERETARAEQRAVRSSYRDRPRDESDARAAAGDSFVFRFKTPLQGATKWDDVVRGAVRLEHKEIGDFVVARSDGSPLFLLSNAVDDADLGMTDVIRGEDHLTNTANQILILQALGHTPPRYAHLPMVLGQDGKKLSKRHGAASLLAFRDEGYLPTGLMNYLALVGWSLDGETEYFTPKSLTESFSLERINKAAGVFDYAKLKDINGRHLRETPVETLLEAAKPFFAAKGLSLDPTDEPTRRLAELARERAKLLPDLIPSMTFLLVDDADLEYDDKAAKKQLAKEGQTDLLREIAAALEADPEFTRESLSQTIHDFCESRELKMGKVGPPLRIAVTGTPATPDLVDCLALLGRERVLNRVRLAIERFRA